MNCILYWRETTMSRNKANIYIGEFLKSQLYSNPSLIFFHYPCSDGLASAATFIYYGPEDLKDSPLKELNLEFIEKCYSLNDKYVFLPTNFSMNIENYKMAIEYIAKLTKLKNETTINLIFLDFFPYVLLEHINFFRDFLLSLPAQINLYVFDHHETALDFYAKFLEDDKKNKELHKIFNNIIIYISPEYKHMCGALTFASAIVNNDMDKIPAALLYINDFDIGVWKYREKSEPFNHYFDSYLNNGIEFIQNFIKALNDKNYLDYAIETGRLLKTFNDRKLENIIENLDKYLHYVKFKNKELNIIVPCINAGLFEYKSHLAELIFTKTDLKIIGLYNIVNNNGNLQVIFSFRSKDNSARMIAEKLGGGGHNKASGAIIPLSDLEFLPNF